MARRRTHRRFASLAAALDADHHDLRLATNTPLGVVIVDLVPGSGDSYSRLEARLGASEARQPVLLRRETSLDRVAKVLAINREVQVGDATFDRIVYIDSEVPAAVLRAMFAQEAAKRAVICLLAEGFDEVWIQSAPSLVSAVRYGRETRVPELDSLRLAVTALQAIASAIPLRVWPPERKGAPLAALVWRLPILLVLLCAAGFGPALVLRAQATYQPVATSIYVAALLVALGAWIAIVCRLHLRIRGRSNSFGELIVWAALIALALPGGTIGAFIACNGAFDGSSPRERRALVARRWTESGEHAADHVDLAGLRGDDVIDVTLKEGQPPLDSGLHVSVETGTGALGWEWIRKVTPLREEDADVRHAPDLVGPTSRPVPSGSKTTAAPRRPATTSLPGPSERVTREYRRPRPRRRHQVVPPHGSMNCASSLNWHVPDVQVDTDGVSTAALITFR